MKRTFIAAKNDCGQECAARIGGEGLVVILKPSILYSGTNEITNSEYTSITESEKQMKNAVGDLILTQKKGLV